MEKESRKSAAVVALTGRWIDANATTWPRFPLTKVNLVRERLAHLFSAENVVALVCSAACGADLIALEEAERQGIRLRIVLPFPPERFRSSWVTHWPGDWSPAFDRFVAAANAAGDLIVTDGAADDCEAAFTAADEAILRQAQLLGQTGAPHRLLAVIVWEGARRSDGDATENFRSCSAKAGFEQLFVPTL